MVNDVCGPDQPQCQGSLSSPPDVQVFNLDPGPALDDASKYWWRITTLRNPHPLSVAFRKVSCDVGNNTVGAFFNPASEGVPF